MDTEVVSGTDIEVASSNEWVSVDVDLSVDPDAVLMAFPLNPMGRYTFAMGLILSKWTIL